MTEPKTFTANGGQTFGNRSVATPPQTPRSEAPKAAPTPPAPVAGKVSIEKGTQAAPTPPKANPSNKK